MQRRARIGSLALALAAVLAVAPATGVHARGLEVGLAEQKATVFDDPFFHRLVLRHARLHVGWDVMENAWERERTERWMAGARAQGVEPLVTFGRSRIDHARVPTPRRFAAQLRAFRRVWPWVRSFAVWNEVNHRGQPTLRRPGLVVRWWRALRRACRGCTLLPAELLDTPNMLSWVRGFQRRARREPAVWGVHAYAEANRFQTARMRALLRAVRGRIWLTETGGIVKIRGRRHPAPYPESRAHAARVTRFVFRRVVPLSSRIGRVYVYNWDATGTGEAWDTALLEHDGRPRPAWHALLTELAELRMRPGRHPAAGRARERVR